MGNEGQKLSLLKRIKRFWRKLLGQRFLPEFRTNVRMIPTKLGNNYVKQFGERIYRTEENLKCILKDGKIQLLECFEVRRQNETTITVSPETSEKKGLYKYVINKDEFPEMQVYSERPIDFERAIIPEENGVISEYANLLANRILSKLEDRLEEQANTLIGMELEGKRMLILDSIVATPKGSLEIETVLEVKKKDYILAINDMQKSKYRLYQYQKEKIQGEKQEAKQTGG